MKRQQSAQDTYAALDVLQRLLPPLLLKDAAVKKRTPALKQRYRKLLDNPAYNVSNNFGAIKHEAEVYYSDEFLSVVASKMGPEREKAYRRTRANARAYISAVEDLATHLGLGESYGPSLIHSFIYSAVTTPGRGRYPATLSRPIRLSLEVAINPMTRYDIDDIPDLPNPVASYYPKDEPLPDVSWIPQGTDGTHFQATATVRDLADLRRVMDAFVGLLERDGGLRLRKPRRGQAYQCLCRNTEWFYLNRCEGKSAGQIADDLNREAEEDAPDTPDVSTIQKGIDQVKLLLSSLRVS